MITKTVKVDRIEVLEDGQLQVRTATIIEEDGEEITRSFSRKVVDVGDDVSGEDLLVQDTAISLHTPARIAARIAAKTKNRIR